MIRSSASISVLVVALALLPPLGVVMAFWTGSPAWLLALFVLAVFL